MQLYNSIVKTMFHYTEVVVYKQVLQKWVNVVGLWNAGGES